QVVVQAVVLHQVARSPEDGDARREAADGAVAHGHVAAVGRADPVCDGPVTGGQPADLVAVAVDGHIVGGDGDRIAGGDCGGQVVAQAPHPLGGDRGGDRIDEAAAGVHGFGAGGFRAERAGGKD